MAVRFEIAVRMLAYLKANNYVPLAQVAQVFSLSEAQVRIYCSHLADAHIGDYYGELVEIEIEDDDGEVWISTKETLGLNQQVKFTTEQSVAIIGGLKYLESLPGLVDQKQISALLMKLQHAFGDQDSIIEIGASEINAQIVEILKQAIDLAKCVRIEYGAAADQKVTTRVIEPVLLQANESVLYVRAYCQESEGMRSFRVDRILSATALDISGDGREAADSDVEIAAADISVSLRMLPEMLESFAPETIIESRFDGDLMLVTLNVTSTKWLTSLVLASAGDIVVIGPESVRAEVLARANAWLSKHPQ